MSDTQQDGYGYGYEHEHEHVYDKTRRINTIPFFMKFYSVLKHLPQASAGVRPKYSAQTSKLLSEHSTKLSRISVSDRPQISMSDLNSVSSELNKYILNSKALCARYSNHFRTANRTLSIGGLFYDTSKLDDGTYSCSAPSSSNYVEWWNMVVAAKIKMITMLTDFVENTVEKSFQYFPLEPYKLFGDSHIDRSSFIIIDHVINPDTASFRAVICKSLIKNYYGIDGLELRELQIVRIEIMNRSYKMISLQHTIMHLHYTKWADRQDIDPTIMLELVSAYGAVYTDLDLQHQHTERSNPVQNLIHCSAGVGRTGTFYVTIRMIRHIVISSVKHKCSPLDIYVNIPEYVLVCRRCRLESVQTPSQLLLIYKTLSAFSDMLKMA